MSGPLHTLSDRLSRPAFLALLGPTASGKTSLSIAVARVLDAEIISMDSRQVYRGMEVGTAKVDAPSRAAVPHHGLDLIGPDETYSAGRFARDARAWIQEIRGRGRVPLLVGGTGFFLRALTDPIFREPALDKERREALRRWLREQPADRLATWVRRLDPTRSDVAVQGGPQRMGRALEVALLTGRALSWWHRSAGPDAEPLAGVTVLLTLPREELDRRIEARVRAMFASGLIDEVRALVAAGYTSQDPGMSGTGYREVLKHLSGEWSLERTQDEIRRATRRYAGRQLTWFRNQLVTGAVTVDAMAPLEEQVARVVEAWRGAQPGVRTG